MVVVELVGRVVSTLRLSWSQGAARAAVPWWRLGVRVFTSPEWGLFALLAIVATAVSMVADLGEVRRQWAQDWASGPVPWLTMVLMPVVWAFDELGRCLMWSRWRDHAPARWRVVWVGICPVPVLHPDDVTRLRQRRKRISVHLWGLLHGGLLTGLAWMLSRNLDDPGQQWVARSWMYASLIVLLCVWINPFWQGAGQSLLQEWGRVPNLAARSRAWWRRLTWELALGLASGLTGARSGDVARSAQDGQLPVWAICHAPLGWCVHWWVAIWLVQTLSPRYPHLALLMLLSASLALVVNPLARATRQAWMHPNLAEHHLRMLIAAALVGATLGGGLFGVPWPRQLMAPAVIGLPAGMEVVSPADAVIATELALDGQSVYDGQALWALQPLHLQGVDRDADEMLDAPGNWGLATLRSAGSGQLQWRLPGDPVGRVVRRGQVLAQLVPHTPPVLRWVVPASRVADLKDVQRVRVRLHEQPGRELLVRVSRWNPVPVQHLPAAAMSTRWDGPVAILQGDVSGLVPAEPLVQLEAPLSERLPRVGGRAWVRMDMVPQALGLQWWARIRALWLAGR
jgi:hypothetical protein